MKKQKVKEYMRKLHAATKDKTRLVHKMFHYACDKCESVKPIYLGYGVEGPEEVYIASPFWGPQCDLCGGDTKHVAFKQDKTFEPRPAPLGATVFSVPDELIEADAFSGSFMGITRVELEGGK